MKWIEGKRANCWPGIWMKEIQTEKGKEKEGEKLEEISKEGEPVG